MNNNPKVSVVIPCFNNETTIIETLNCILNQEYKDIEVIIVNDGSKDNSKEVITDFIINKSNLNLINQNNSGPSNSRNTGSETASGKYLLFLDADDLIAPSFIKKSVELLEKDEKLNIVYSKAEFFDAKKGIWNLSDFKMPNFLIDNCIPITALIRTEVFRKVGKFDEKLGFTEDWELWIRIVLQFGGVYQIPEVLFYYRQRYDKSSITDNKNLDAVKERTRLYIYNKHYKYYATNGYDITSILTSKTQNERYKIKYYNVWYRKLFYLIKNKKNLKS
jgi:glycosyltransferase involved in cell wall biosynthesis